MRTTVIRSRLWPAIALTAAIAVIFAAGTGPGSAGATGAEIDYAQERSASVSLGNIADTQPTNRHERVDADDRVDYFHFSLSHQRIVRLRVRRLDYNADLYVEDHQGTVIASSEKTGDQKEVLNITLAPTGADDPYYVRVEAKENGQNDYEFRYLTGTPPNAGPSGLPTITGTVLVGKTLSADTSGISDGNGLTDPQYSYQWIRNDGGTDTTISGATGQTYTVTGDDLNRTIKVRVSFTDDAGYTASLTSAVTGSVARSADEAPTGLPTVTGTAQVHETLSADTSGISDGNGLSDPQYTYQWIRNDGNADSNIPGATGQTYTLTDDDLNSTMKVSVSFTDDGGYTATLTSAATGSVARPDDETPTGLPTITGTEQVGETLSADTSGISDGNGLTNPQYTYQWIRNDGSTDAEIAGATSSTYVLTADDAEKAIKVQVSLTDDDGYTATLTSAATGSVARPPNAVPGGLPTITGKAQVGETLSADTSGISDGNGLSNPQYSYQWVRSDGDSDTSIPGATAQTYTLTDDDLNKAVKARVSFTDDDGYSHTLTSDAMDILETAPLRSNASVSEPEGQDFPADNTTTGKVGIGGEGATGNLGSGSDIDAFHIDLESGKRYRIDVLGKGPRDHANGGTYPGELELQVRNLDGSIGTSFDRLNGFGEKDPAPATTDDVVNVAGGPDLGARSEFDITADGTYLVKVISDGTNTGTYTVRASEITSEQMFGDFTSQWNSGRVRIDDTAAMTGTLGESRDNDWYMTSLEAGKCYSIQARGEHSDPAHDGGTLTDPKVKVMNFFDYYHRRFYDPDTLVYVGVPDEEKTVAYYDETYINPSNFELLNRADKVCNMVRPHDQPDSYKLICNYYCDDDGGPGSNSLIKVRVGTGGAGDYVIGVEGQGSTGTYSVYVKEINCPSD